MANEGVEQFRNDDGEEQHAAKSEAIGPQDCPYALLNVAALCTELLDVLGDGLVQLQPCRRVISGCEVLIILSSSRVETGPHCVGIELRCPGCTAIAILYQTHIANRHL